MRDNWAIYHPEIPDFLRATGGHAAHAAAAAGGHELRV